MPRGSRRHRHRSCRSDHDVAQVVGAGYSVSAQTGDAATVIKLARVALLAPVILVLLAWFRHSQKWAFARIHAQNLSNFGVLPLTFVDPADYDGIQVGDVLRLAGVRRTLAEGGELVVENVTRQRNFQVRHFMSPRQVQFLLRGGLINWMKERLSGSPEPRGA